MLNINHYKTMKRIIVSFFLLASINAFAQTETLSKEDLGRELQSLKTSIQALQNENAKLKSDISYLNNQLSTANKNIDSLKIQTQNNSSAISQTANELGVKISATETNANYKINEVDKSLNKKSLWAIIGILLAIIISGIVYWFLSKKQITDKKELIENLNNTKISIEESLIKEFVKQTVLLETQLQLIEDQAKNQSTNITNQEIDHSLALKVADEITLIERNISLMDKDVKGLKQLSRSIQKLKDNLNANGYEIPELLGKQFNQGMKLTVVSSIPDDNLNKGDEIISKIIKPQVNYRSKMIQAAQVEVSIG